MHSDRLLIAVFVYERHFKRIAARKVKVHHIKHFFIRFDGCTEVGNIFFGCLQNGLAVPFCDNSSVLYAEIACGLIGAYGYDLAAVQFNCCKAVIVRRDDRFVILIVKISFDSDMTIVKLGTEHHDCISKFACALFPLGFLDHRHILCFKAGKIDLFPFF